MTDRAVIFSFLITSLRHRRSPPPIRRRAVNCQRSQLASRFAGRKPR